MKKKVSKLSQRDEDWFSGKSLKERKLAVNGQPDQTDVFNLNEMFKIYDRTSGGKLRRFCNQLAIERSANSRSMLRSADKEERVAFSLPQDLQLFMEKYYPTIWTNQKHARWFVKTFPVFRR